MVLHCYQPNARAVRVPALNRPLSGAPQGRALFVFPGLPFGRPGLWLTRPLRGLVRGLSRLSRVGVGAVREPPLQQQRGPPRHGARRSSLIGKVRPEMPWAGQGPGATGRRWRRASRPTRKRLTRQPEGLGLTNGCVGARRAVPASRIPDRRVDKGGPGGHRRPLPHRRGVAARRARRAVPLHGYWPHRWLSRAGRFAKRACTARARGPCAGAITGAVPRGVFGGSGW